MSDKPLELPELDYLFMKLCSQDKDIRLEAAAELTRLGIRTRDIPTNIGELQHVPPRRLVMDKEQVSLVARSLKDDVPEVRRQLAFFVGDLLPKNDQEILKVIKEQIRTEPDERNRSVIVETLIKAAGLEELDLILEITEKDPSEMVKARALHTLANLRAEPSLSEEKIQKLEAVIRRIAANDSSDYVQRIATGIIQWIETLVE